MAKPSPSATVNNKAMQRATESSQFWKAVANALASYLKANSIDQTASLDDVESAPKGWSYFRANKKTYVLPQAIGLAVYYMYKQHFQEGGLQMFNADTILSMLEVPVINDAVITHTKGTMNAMIPAIDKAYLVAKETYAATGKAGDMGITIDADKVEYVTRQVAVYNRWFKRPGCDITSWVTLYNKPNLMAKEMESVDFAQACLDLDLTVNKSIMPREMEGARPQAPEILWLKRRRDNQIAKQ
ncbi:hypothetical protein CGRA01v4_14468 [Colletotrichum graminicola]|nr:hypothetical protein CGRA01v4_14468 [Colletotrichum graminicola]